mmetsp:Transcript_3043/g.7924  ORF Transcript_3043/g.7924 Transcript_3043/m.7924 type:complete len:285 (+) Transcript_3043:699-1553(+)
MGTLAAADLRGVPCPRFRPPGPRPSPPAAEVVNGEAARPEVLRVRVPIDRSGRTSFREESPRDQARVPIDHNGRASFKEKALGAPAQAQDHINRRVPASSAAKEAPRARVPVPIDRREIASSNNRAAAVRVRVRVRAPIDPGVCSSASASCVYPLPPRGLVPRGTRHTPSPAWPCRDGARPLLKTTSRRSRPARTWPCGGEEATATAARTARRALPVGTTLRPTVVRCTPPRGKFPKSLARATAWWRVPATMATSATSRWSRPTSSGPPQRRRQSIPHPRRTFP